MTRDEQMTALLDWRMRQVTAEGIIYRTATEAILDNFPSFMEKCAEIGLCTSVTYPNSTAYNVPKSLPPHQHDWHVFGVTLDVVYLTCFVCYIKRTVPNSVPLEEVPT